MLFTTPTQWFALAVALVAGWLFGLASHPGGKKWKARYLAERDAHADTTKRSTELERERVAVEKKRTDWERERGDFQRERIEWERDRAAAPVVVAEPVARPAVDPAYRDEDRDRRI